MSSPREVVALLLFAIAACGDDSATTTPGTHVDDWRDEVVYQLVTDRFENGDASNDTLGVGIEPGALERFQGGDWRGIEQRLSYIERLGATAIWISPIVANVERIPESDGYHGYWASDFTTINARFGSLEDLKSLTRAAHERGIKVIVDIVTNHVGPLFTYDLDGDGAVGEGELEPPFVATPYDATLLWQYEMPRLFVPGSDGAETFALDETFFHRQGTARFDRSEAERFGDFPSGLRDIATERAEVIDGMIETYAHWALEIDADGFRIDAAPLVDHAFWKGFCAGLRSKLAEHGKHRFLLVGEVYDGDARVIAPYVAESELDSAFDFPLKWLVIDGVVLGGGAPSMARDALETNRTLLDTAPQAMGVELTPWQARFAFGDNHDVWRLRSELDDDQAIALALAVVFTVDAIPVVYYGTEADLSGRDHHAAREPLFVRGFVENRETFQTIARLARIRRSSAALRRGELVLRYASEHDGLSMEPDAGVLAYERIAGDERALIAIGTHARQVSSAVIPTGFAEGTVLHDALDEGNDWRVGANGELRLTLLPRSARILVPD